MGVRLSMSVSCCVCVADLVSYELNLSGYRSVYDSVSEAGSMAGCVCMFLSVSV